MKLVTWARCCDNVHTLRTNFDCDNYAKPRSFMTFFMMAPIWAGDLLIVTPADSKALILSVAVPLPPAMMAPACPIRLPGGAVNPAECTQAQQTQL